MTLNPGSGLPFRESRNCTLYKHQVLSWGAGHSPAQASQHLIIRRCIQTNEISILSYINCVDSLDTHTKLTARMSCSWSCNFLHKLRQTLACFQTSIAQWELILKSMVTSWNSLQKSAITEGLDFLRSKLRTRLWLRLVESFITSRLNLKHMITWPNHGLLYCHLISGPR
jgi:hypothetical protein